jgi:SAM-dependent methyltransferase
MEKNIEIGTRLLTLSMIDCKNAKRVLDIGSGNGEFTCMIKNCFNGNTEVVGMDNNPNFTEMALSMYGYKTILADADKPFPFDNNSFDLVICSQIIEHLYNTDQFVSEIYRILKYDGVCVCSTPNLASVHNIICLLLGYQPFTCHISDMMDLGTLYPPLHPEWSEPKWLGMKHRRIFTARSLKGIFEYYGFKCESIKGFGYYFMPQIIQELIKSPRHSAYMTIRARK